MRLADFILANVEPILVEWEAFARSVWPATSAPLIEELRNDAAHILIAAAHDMQSAQTSAEQTAKSQGLRKNQQGERLDSVSATHGSGRAASGFALRAVIAEYRALRASVLRLWRESNPSPDARDLEDVTRFNEAIDESVAEAVESFAEESDRMHSRLLASEQDARKGADEANRAKDIFLATLSHELRTPLNAIVGWLSILRSEGHAPGRMQEGIEVIHRNARAQVKIIDDVLDVSRIVSGKLNLEIRPCELISAIESGLEVAKPGADAKHITLRVDLDPAASAASVDPTRIQQVVWNLVSNAVKFTPRGGQIDVSLKRHESFAQLEVKDDGRGIDAELLPHVFERFRQADSSSRRSFSGLGLGLSIVKYIVEAHGGTVVASSAGEGLGSTFTVRLPVIAVSVAAERLEPIDSASFEEPEGEQAEIPFARLDGLRVLVVDDEADARRVLALVLERAGAEVTTVDGADSALAELASSRPRVLISDLGMPEQDGFDLIRQVRHLGHDEKALPAIALTAFVQPHDERLALAAGFQVHIRKPVDPHVLTSVVAGLVSQGA